MEDVDVDLGCNLYFEQYVRLSINLSCVWHVYLRKLVMSIFDLDDNYRPLG
jgi:hypothetical protein